MKNQIEIELKDEQLEVLRPFDELIDQLKDESRKGALVAQVWPEHREIVIRFCNSDEAEILKAAFAQINTTKEENKK